MDALLSDQFAFAPPAGSTTAAIVSILYHSSSLTCTSTNSLDFPKAFDCAQHFSFINKLTAVNLPDFIYNWYADSLEDRSPVTRFGTLTSSLAHIHSLYNKR